MTNDAPALVFIYDRELADDTEESASRISACREYAKLVGWEVAGQWVERGGSGNRLIWRGMAVAMAFQGNGRRAICLVAAWDRISTDPQKRAALRHLVQQAGGTCWAVDTEAGQVASSS